MRDFLIGCLIGVAIIVALDFIPPRQKPSPPVTQFHLPQSRSDCVRGVHLDGEDIIDKYIIHMIQTNGILKINFMKRPYEIDTLAELENVIYHSHPVPPSPEPAKPSKEQPLKSMTPGEIKGDSGSSCQCALRGFILDPDHISVVTNYLTSTWHVVSNTVDRAYIQPTGYILGRDLSSLGTNYVIKGSNAPFCNIPDHTNRFYIGAGKPNTIEVK